MEFRFILNKQARPVLLTVIIVSAWLMSLLITYYYTANSKFEHSFEAGALWRESAISHYNSKIEHLANRLDSLEEESSEDVMYFIGHIDDKDKIGLLEEEDMSPTTYLRPKYQKWSIGDKICAFDNACTNYFVLSILASKINLRLSVPENISSKKIDLYFKLLNQYKTIKSKREKIIKEFPITDFSSQLNCPLSQILIGLFVFVLLFRFYLVFRF